ncbi:MAG TPA: hypothetical protein VH105_21890 [Burkholderiales bacterium]|jgi:hypothetical protein|nr:hypothetical protein [Burkholderiales bacterium]
MIDTTIQHEAAEAARAAPVAQASQSAGAAPAPAGDSASDAGWHAGIADENLRRWAQAKGWKDPLAAVESNYNLERLIGLDRAGRTVVLPREDATPEELSAFRQRLGVPENAAGYALPLPEGAPPEFAREAAQWMHEAGVPAKAASTLAQRWNAYTEHTRQAAERAYQVESATHLAALKSEWGSGFEVNAEHARRAALHFLPGADADARQAQMGKLERTLGTAPFMRFMANVGRGLSEHALFSSGDSGGMAGHTPASARARIAELRADKGWTASYIAGDAGKAAEMNRLHRVAFGKEEE